MLPYLQQAGLVPSPPTAELLERLTQILEAAGDRIKIAGDILDYAGFFLPDDRLPYDEQAFEKRTPQSTGSGPLVGQVQR